MSAQYMMLNDARHYPNLKILGFCVMSFQPVIQLICLKVIRVE